MKHVQSESSWLGVYMLPAQRLSRPISRSERVNSWLTGLSEKFVLEVAIQFILQYVYGECFQRRRVEVPKAGPVG